MSYQEQTTANQGISPYNQKAMTKNLLETLEQLGGFSQFAAAVRKSGLEPYLTGPNLYTVFATEDGKLELPPATSPEQLRELMEHQIVKGANRIADMRTAATLKTLRGAPVPVSWEEQQVCYGNIPIVRGDIACTNGVIHVLRGMMLPQVSYAS